MLDLGQGPEPIVEEPDEVRESYRKLDSNLTELAQTPTVVAFDREIAVRRRITRAFLGLLALMIIAGYFFTYSVAQEVGRTSARQELLRGTVASLEQANTERQAAGLPAIPIGDIVAQLDEKGLVDAVTTTVLVKIESDPRFRGPEGLPGGVGAPGAAGEAGATGAPGAAGLNGVNGIPGADGQAGPAGTQGVPGEKGDKGEQGADGPKPTGAEFLPDGQGGCNYVTTYSDGSTVSAQTNLFNCP